jgi:hypothetical protein
MYQDYCCVKAYVFLGAVEKLRNVAFSFVVSVRQSIRPSSHMEQLGTPRTDFHKI